MSAPRKKPLPPVSDEEREGDAIPDLGAGIEAQPDGVDVELPADRGPGPQDAVTHAAHQDDPESED